jgi:polar amino acid transport system substrate-binding protein
MPDSLATARAELAPTGTLRVALNMSNFLLTATEPTTNEPRGIAADLGRELGQRLGVPVALLPYANPGALADAATAGVWDVGFIGAEPQRADTIDFTAAYVEIEATYLVPPGSPLQTIADVDRPGVRIVAPARSAYELYLSRTLQHAQLIREQGGENAFKRFVEDHLDALAGLRPRLVIDQEAVPGSRLLDGRFTAVQQAAGTPKGRPAGAQYLRAFIEEVKTTGLVAQLIAKHQVRGLTVAAPA